MSPDSNSEFAAAIAAAAFAIHVHGAGGEVSSDPDYLRNKLMPMGRAKTRKQFDPVRPAESSRRFPDIEANDASGRRNNRERSQKGTWRERTALEDNADAWEKAAIAKIRKRYEKMNSRIIAWENVKKMKVKERMEAKKREMEQRIQVNLQHYQNKLARIDNSARGARLQLEEKRRHEEAEVKQRAKRIRSSTGKLPVPSCCCFRLR
ncbi:uncharacterized protein At3g61260-like [Diospyros lotus]|uniref:uncharacterized protein At3g61260-like n=1 Tax=Diospyros lotus TaxID=55363 RepID=UPI0022552050|nr:uncharacterized protein At3g61260-like [Diospyros lotus]